MKCVLLDRASFDFGDIDFAPLQHVVPQWTSYPQSTREETVARLQDAVIAISNKVALDRDILRQAKALRLVCVAATGTNNVDLEAAQERGIVICNARAYATPSVVEHVLMLMLALKRNLMAYAQSSRDGRWMRSSQFCYVGEPIGELAGQTLGIVGYGELGRAVAQASQALGLRVLIAQRPGSDAAEAGRVPLDELLPQVDILSLHCPLTEQTRGLIDAKRLARMKPGALLINTARGGIVDEAALVESLRGGHLGGAGVDVLSHEPPAEGNILLQAELPNLIVTPHVAWASRAARQRLLQEVALNIEAFLHGEERNRVN